MYVSLYKDYKAIYKPPHKVHIKTVLQRTKNGKHKELIENIRNCEDKKERNELKNLLPCVVFSGYCGKGVKKKGYISFREDDSLTEHSGLCPIDLDDVVEYMDLEKAKFALSNLHYVYSAFISPSGKGLRAICKIPASIKTHRGYYRGILRNLESFGFKVDGTSINESRVSFESYDPNLYLNENATEFTDYIEEKSEEVVKITKVAETTDYSKLNIAARMIANAPDGYKHHTLIKAAYLMGGFVTSGKVKEDDAVKMLQDSISARDIDDKRNAFKTIDDGIKKGKLKPIYEIEEIEEEFNLYISRKEFQDEQRRYNFLVDTKELDNKLYNYIENGEEEGKSTGYDDLDNHFRFKENNFNVILGHDNVGKSFIIWFLAVVASAKHGWKWIIYSPENKTYRIKKQLLDFVLGEKINKQTHRKVISRAKAFVDEHFIFVRKDKEFNAFELLEYGAILCQEDKDIKGFMIDPYNSLSLDYKNKGQGLSSYEYHLKVATNMRIFAEKYCSIYLNAHSVTGSRRNMTTEDGVLKRPQKGDIEQGGLWANRCDDFIVIHRKVKSEDEWMFTEFHVDKVKDVETGGGVTYSDPVRLRLNYYSDFVNDYGNSALTSWRKGYFQGEQQQIPLLSPEEAF